MTLETEDILLIIVLIAAVAYTVWRSRQLFGDWLFIRKYESSISRDTKRYLAFYTVFFVIWCIVMGGVLGLGLSGLIVQLTDAAF